MCVSLKLAHCGLESSTQPSPKTEYKYISVKKKIKRAAKNVEILIHCCCAGPEMRGL